MTLSQLKPSSGEPKCLLSKDKLLFNKIFKRKERKEHSSTNHTTTPQSYPLAGLEAPALGGGARALTDISGLTPR